MRIVERRGGCRPTLDHFIGRGEHPLSTTHLYPWTHDPRHRFTGHIAGVGTSQGDRLVLGCWSTPQGPLADVVAHRTAVVGCSPTEWVADFVSAAYSFDTVTRVP
ncbi:hypothetical protein QJS66_13470 [Kocuria rhizophila]|nr:hypothetical protein QJS66_13470 [Kocuria rhizophila]